MNVLLSKYELFICIPLAMLFISCRLHNGVLPSDKSQLNHIHIDKLFFSEKIDIINQRAINPSTQFPSTTREIYVSFQLETNKKIPITIAWYENGILVVEQNITSDTQWLAAQIHPRFETFRAGRYNVQVLSDKLLLKEDEFEILKIK